MKRTHIVGAVFFIILFVFLFIYMSLNTVGEDVYLGSQEVSTEADGWGLSVNGEAQGTISIPTEVKGQKYDRITIEKQISLANTDEQYLCFRSSQNQVWVYVDDELVYTYGVEGTYALNKSPGSAWNMVVLDAEKETCNVKIELSSPYKNFSGMIETVYVGTRTGIFTFLLKHYIPGCFIGFLYILVAIFVLGSYLILRNVRIECGIYFSLIIFHLGLWFLSESKLDQFIFHTPYLCSQLNCILVVSFPITLLLYILSLDEYQSDKILHAVYVLSLINAAVVTALDCLQVYDFVETLPTVGVIGVGILAGVLRNIYLRWKPKKSLEQLNWRDFGLSFMVITGLHDLLNSYYRLGLSTGKWFHLGVLIFIVLIFTGFEKEFVNMYFMKIEDDRFKVLAYTDALTGLENRASFEEKMDELRSDNQPEDEVYIIVIDINNLKDINDTLGHKLGDRAIIQVAKAIYNTFSKYGFCYRIGGDEFCIIIHKIHGIKLKYIIDKLTHDIEDANFVEGFRLSVASGYEKYDITAGNVDDALTRADKKMYNCKQYMKGTGKKQVDRI